MCACFPVQSPRCVVVNERRACANVQRHFLLCTLIQKKRYVELPRCCCTGVLCTRESDFYCCESLHSTLLRILGFFILAFVSVAIWLYHRTIFALFGSVFGAGLHVPTLEAAARSAAETGSRRRPAGRGVLGWLWRLHYDWLDWNGLDKGAKLG